MSEEISGSAGAGRLTRRSFLGATAGLGATVAGAGLLAACGSSSSSGDPASTAGASTSRATRGGKTKYGNDSQLIVHTSDNLFFEQWIVGYKLACKAFDLTPNIGYSNDQAAGEISVLQTALSRGARYISTVGPTDAVIKQVAQLCNKSEAWLSDYGASPPWTMVQTMGDYYRSYNQDADFLLCYNLGKRLFNAMGGSGEVIHVLGLPGFGVSYLRAQGYRQAAKEFPGIKIVAENYGDYNRVSTEPVFAAMFDAHPNVKGVLNGSDDSNMGCISVLEARHATDVLLVSVDAIPEFLDYMEKGQYALASASILGTWLGAWLVAQTYDAAHGVEVSPLERQLTYGSVIIEGKEAAKAYSELVLDPGAAERIYDPLLMSRHLHPHDWAPQNDLAVMDPLDPHGIWIPEIAAGYAKKPSGWTPPPSWSKAAANGGLSTTNRMLSTAAGRKDPLSPIRKLVGPSILTGKVRG
jgi:ABC-type sugar transport system substrate-binding protein